MASQSHTTTYDDSPAGRTETEAGELAQDMRMQQEANALRVILYEDDTPHRITVIPSRYDGTARVAVWFEHVTPATVKLIRDTDYWVYEYTEGGVRLIREFPADD